MFTRMSAEGSCEARRRGQDSFVINALGDGFTADVRGEKLTIFGARSRDRLVYRKR